MAANTQPVYPKTAKLGFAQISATANTARDGTGTLTTLHTVTGADGARVGKITLRHLGTNVATVVRIFLSTTSDANSAANTWLFKERTMPANTLSQVAESTEQEIVMDLWLPTGYTIRASVGTTVASGIMATVWAPEY